MSESQDERKTVIELGRISGEIMAKGFLKNITPQIEEVLCIISSTNTKKTTPRYIIVKLLQGREGSNNAMVADFRWK